MLVKSKQRVMSVHEPSQLSEDLLDDIRDVLLIDHAHQLIRREVDGWVATSHTRV